MNPKELLNTNMALFAAIGGICLIAAAGVVFFNNAIRSALCLVVSFFMLAFLYFTLGAEMIGILQIVVYTGAIMVLFLFTIMLLNLGSVKSLMDRRDPKMLIGGVLGLGMAALLGAQVIVPLANMDAPRATPVVGTPQSVGYSLFSTYIYPFEIVSVLLLVGIVGSILLAKRRI